jgi:hypothetical protein
MPRPAAATSAAHIAGKLSHPASQPARQFDNYCLTSDNTRCILTPMIVNDPGDVADLAARFPHWKITVSWVTAATGQTTASSSLSAAAW